MQYPLTDYTIEEDLENAEEEGKDEINEENREGESRDTLGRRPSMASIDTSQDLNASQDMATRRQSVAASNNPGKSIHYLIELVDLWFNVPVNNYGHVETVS